MDVQILDIDSLHLKLQTEFPFLSRNPNWVNNDEQNAYFIKRYEAIFNDMLVMRGHLFLNEALKDLGIPLIQSGQIMGWAHKDGLIDVVEIEIGYDSLDGTMWLKTNPHRIILDLLLN